MSSIEAIKNTIYPYRPLVKDMAEDLLDIISEYNPSKLGRVANNSKDRITSSTVNICWQLDGVFDDLKGIDTPQLFENEQRQIIENRVTTAAIETGKMTLANMVTLFNLNPHFYSCRNKRFGIINPNDRKRYAPDDWVEDYWASDYAKRFAAATMLGLRKEG